MTTDHYIECDICDERFQLAPGERPTRWLIETETPDGEVVSHCRSCKVTNPDGTECPYCEGQGDVDCYCEGTGCSMIV